MVEQLKKLAIKYPVQAAVAAYVAGVFISCILFTYEDAVDGALWERIYDRPLVLSLVWPITMFFKAAYKIGLLLSWITG